MLVKRIILLANSRKNMDRCIAGIEILPEGYGDWIRPVSQRLGGGLNEHERCYANKNEPRTLDIIEIALACHKPHLNHTEDWATSSRRQWSKKGSIPWDIAFTLIDLPDTLWINGYSTYHGINDEIPLNLSQNLKNSLYLISIEFLNIHIVNGYHNNKKILASFNYKNIKYKLSVTDSFYEDTLKNLEIGEYTYNKCLLTISLSEPFIKSNGNSCQYKLIAAIIPKDQESK